MSSYQLAIVGGGNMGAALLGGLLAASWAAADEIVVIEPIAATRVALAARFVGVAITDQPTAAAGTVLAVKPGDVAAAAAGAASAGTGRILSIAAGVTTARIEAATGAAIPVVRAMPNTPALVGRGAAAIAAGRHADEGDLSWAEGILSSVGIVVRVPESQLDAVTGLSGSGPAYVFLLAEAMTDAGVLVGLPRDTSRALAVQTLLGAATLLATDGRSAEELRAAVTSPGGTTVAGLLALERAGMRAAVMEAVRAATERSRELDA
ncbi:MAG: pyrroline-5-carboxylate reductase [Acidimicrobiaceae bacterium]|jgi:pyrroline-5-carboxylate reductase|nr:pyrroline-5-carboxylate reductase [Acidimicrobiaceae bacterium]